MFVSSPSKYDIKFKSHSTCFLCLGKAALTFPARNAIARLENNTVEPRLYGHQGDMPKCPYYRGVRQ